MQRVDLITDFPFWASAHGTASRIRSLVEFLAPRTTLRVVFLDFGGSLGTPAAATGVESARGHFDLIGVAIDRGSKEHSLAAAKAVFEDDPPSVAIVVNVQLTWILDALPPGTGAFLDTNQIAHERNERFDAAGLPRPNTIDAASEYAAFDRYERIILIHNEDRDTVAQSFDAERLLVAPHPVRCIANSVRERVHRVGFVGSEYLPNVEGLRWFLDAVWPSIDDSAVRLDICGGVGRVIDHAALPSNARCHGIVADLDAAYRSFDIAINPVRAGGGLKIKTVEALGAGLPLVTTPEGARGLRDAAGEAFLLARDEHEFAGHLAALSASRELRERLALAARCLAAERFSPEVCFGPLLRAIEDTS